MKKLSSNSIRKAVLQASLALLLSVTYMTSMSSCGKGAVAMDSVSKSENWYTSDSAAGYDDYYGEIEPEAPSKESIYDSTASSEEGAQINDQAAWKLIKTANLTVETKDFDQFLSTLEAEIAAKGGYLSSSSINGNSYSSIKSRYANLTIRIPADTYEAFVSGIGGYGNVTYRSESVSDVTMAYVDTESRIKAYEAEYNTLLEILDKAETLSDVLVIQNRITEVTYQLESYRSQLRKYDDLVSYCTVHVNINEVVELTEVKEPPQTLLQRMERGLSDTWDDVVDNAEDFAVGFVSSLPVLLIWVVIVVIVIFAARGIAKVLTKKTKKSESKDDRKGN